MNTQKNLQKIREWERELITASPARAARLTAAIVRLKSTIFDKKG